jgi:hypothetical protein
MQVVTGNDRDEEEPGCPKETRHSWFPPNVLDTCGTRTAPHIYRPVSDFGLIPFLINPDLLAIEFYKV